MLRTIPLNLKGKLASSLIDQVKDIKMTGSENGYRDVFVLIRLYQYNSEPHMSLRMGLNSDNNLAKNEININIVKHLKDAKLILWYMLHTLGMEY